VKSSGSDGQSVQIQVVVAGQFQSVQVHHALKLVTQAADAIVGEINYLQGAQLHQTGRHLTLPTLRHR
jgi:hypothetical protein